MQIIKNWINTNKNNNDYNIITINCLFISIIFNITKDKWIKRYVIKRWNYRVKCNRIFVNIYISILINSYYTMEFPRPYDIVIYFVAPSCKLCNDLNE